MLVFLRAAGPHGAFDLGLTFKNFHRMGNDVRAGQRPHPNVGGLIGRHAQGHFVFLEGHNKHFQIETGNFLFFDPDDLPHPMRGIDDEVVDLEIEFLGF